MQREVHRDGHDHRHRRTIQQRRHELPLHDGVDRGLIEHRYRPQHFGVHHHSRCVDRRLENHDTLDASPHGVLWIDRTGVANFCRRLDVPADANGRTGGRGPSTEWRRRRRWRSNARAPYGHARTCLVQFHGAVPKRIGFGNELCAARGIGLVPGLMAQEDVLVDHRVDEVRIVGQRPIFCGNARQNVVRSLGRAQLRVLPNLLFVERRQEVMARRIRWIGRRNFFEHGDALVELIGPDIEGDELSDDDVVAWKREAAGLQRRFRLVFGAAALLDLRELVIQRDR